MLSVGGVSCVSLWRASFGCALSRFCWRIRQNMKVKSASELLSIPLMWISFVIGLRTTGRMYEENTSVYSRVWYGACTYEMVWVNGGEKLVSLLVLAKWQHINLSHIKAIKSSSLNNVQWNISSTPLHCYCAHECAATESIEVLKLWLASMWGR